MIASTRRTIPTIPTSSSNPSAPKWDVASSRRRDREGGGGAGDRGEGDRERRVPAREVCEHVRHHSSPARRRGSRAPRRMPARGRRPPATAKASSGEISARLVSPIATPRGKTTTRRKSAGVSEPRLPMITAERHRAEAGRRRSSRPPGAAMGGPFPALALRCVRSARGRGTRPPADRVAEPAGAPATATGVSQLPGRGRRRMGADRSVLVRPVAQRRRARPCARRRSA